MEGNALTAIAAVMAEWIGPIYCLTFRRRESDLTQMARWLRSIGLRVPVSSVRLSLHSVHAVHFVHPSRGEIRQMFMMEAGFIGLIGGVFGLLLGWVVGLVLNQTIQFYFKHMPRL